MISLYYSLYFNEQFNTGDKLFIIGKIRTFLLKKLVLMFAGGNSFGCSSNAGAAGTYYDAVPRSLYICNHNLSTQTDTLLLEFPKVPLWTNIYVQNQAKALFPLYWSRVQVIELLSIWLLFESFISGY